MKQLFRKIRDSRFTYSPLVEVQINKKQLLDNLHYFQSLDPGMQIAPVLKSNAYGHDYKLIAEILENQNIPFLVVDSYYEALILRNEGIKKPLLIIGYTEPDNIIHNKLDNIAFTLVNDELSWIDKIKKPTYFHIKFDTGMHRQGLLANMLGLPSQSLKNVPRLPGQYSKNVPRLPSENNKNVPRGTFQFNYSAPSDELTNSGGQARGTFNKLIHNPNIFIQGICSHFADVDTANSPITKQQISSWNALVDKASQIFPTIQYFHISASDALQNVPRLPGQGLKNVPRGTFTQSRVIKLDKNNNQGGQARGTLLHPKTNVARLGLGLYGFANTDEVQPVLSMKTKITSIREIQPGDTVGYGGTFVAKEKMKLATIPVGYYEGLDRRLSNIGFVKWLNNQNVPRLPRRGFKNVPRGTFCRIIGTVSMNIASIDVTDVQNIAIGDEIEVISAQKSDKNSILSYAQQSKTIPYELLIHIPAKLRRKCV